MNFDTSKKSEPEIICKLGFDIAQELKLLMVERVDDVKDNDSKAAVIAVAAMAMLRDTLGAVRLVAHKPLIELAVELFDGPDGPGERLTDLRKMIAKKGR